MGLESRRHLRLLILVEVLGVPVEAERFLLGSVTFLLPAVILVISLKCVRSFKISRADILSITDQLLFLLSKRQSHLTNLFFLYY